MAAYTRKMIIASGNIPEGFKALTREEAYMMGEDLTPITNKELVLKDVFKPEEKTEDDNL